MKSIALIATLLTATIAHADGFLCETESGLNVKVYNHTQANEGTRNAAIMVISDSSVGQGNKTIAKFTDVKNTLSSKSSKYVAKVDLRVSESNRKGELIGGTKLGFIDLIVLSVDFSYNSPVESGDEVTAELEIYKRNGDVLSEQAVCQRYLKN